MVTIPSQGLRYKHMTKDYENSVLAVAMGLTDGGVKYTTNYPGFNSQNIFKAMGGGEISTNESLACEMAYGASLAGTRSATMMKNTGLSSCADIFIHTVFAGVNSGMVLVICDDLETVSSPERQDSRPFFDFYGGLWFEPTSVQEAYRVSREAPMLSEKFDLPIVIRLTNQYFKLKEAFTRKPEVPATKIVHQREKYISHFTYRHRRHLQRLRSISEYVDGLYVNAIAPKHKLGVISFGVCIKELESIKEPFDLLEINTYPLPEDTITSFSASHDSIYILEQGNDFASQKVQAIIGRSLKKIRVETGTIPDYSSQWSVFNYLEKLFKALSLVSENIVVGDEGLYTEESLKVIDACLAMGTSVGIAMGVAEVTKKFTFSVIGDGSFLHRGIHDILEASAKNLPLCVIVLDNNGTHSTGGQKLPASIRSIPSGIDSIEVNYSETSEAEFETLLKDISKNKKLKIIFVNIPKP